jgi:hypothetical protein
VTKAVLFLLCLLCERTNSDLSLEDILRNETTDQLSSNSAVFASHHPRLNWKATKEVDGYQNERLTVFVFSVTDNDGLLRRDR